METSSFFSFSMRMYDIYIYICMSTVWVNGKVPRTAWPLGY